MEGFLAKSGSENSGKGISHYILVLCNVCICSEIQNSFLENV